MLGNQITTALRHMNRYRGYTAINVLGLAVGLVCAILIFLYVRYELSYDRYHEKADRIYRVTLNDSARSPRELGPILQADFPEIQQFARLLPTIGTWVMKHGDRVYYEKNVYWANNELFDVFTFPLLRGDPDHALEAPFTVVISEDTARKYFGDEDPMGKTIVADNGYLLLTVTGVMDNIPENSHFHPEFLISLPTGYDKFEWSETPRIFYNNLFHTYIVLPEGHPPSETQEKLTGFVEKHVDASFLEDIGRFELTLQPVTDIHLYSHLEDEHRANTDISYVYILSAIGLFILVIASVNYVNLSTAQFAHRAREIGMRKVLGASRGQLIRKYLGESVLMTTVAMAIALVAVYFLAPQFRQPAGPAGNRGPNAAPAVVVRHAGYRGPHRAPVRGIPGPGVFLHAGHYRTQGRTVLPTWRPVVQENPGHFSVRHFHRADHRHGHPVQPVELHTEQETGIRNGPGDRHTHGSAGSGQLPAVERCPVAVHRSGRREPGHNPARSVRYHRQDVDRYDTAHRGSGPRPAWRPGIPGRRGLRGDYGH